MTIARAAYTVAALATVAGGVSTAPAPSAWALVLACAVALSAHLLRQQIRVSATVFYLAWGEAAVVVGLFLVPAGWVPLVVATGFLGSVAARVLATGRPPPRTTAEVVGSLTVAAGAAAAAARLVADPYGASLGPGVTTALVLAALTYLLVSTAAVHLKLLLRGQRPIQPLLRRTLLYKLPMTAGSMAVGIGAVALAHVDWRWLLGLPAILWVLHHTYGHPVRTNERRRIWSALARATRSFNRPDEGSVALAGVRGALEVFGVARAEVALAGGGRPERAWIAHASGVVEQCRTLPEAPSATAVPLLAGYQQIGRLRLWFPEPAGPGNGEHAALQAYADALTAALQDTATHRQLHRLLERSSHDAQHDPLTGLLNRGALLTRGDAALHLARHGAPVALLLVDVDHFREINDTLGHAAGDEVLIVTGARLAAAAGPRDLLSRLGGDEFALLVTDTGVRSGAAALEDARQAALARGRELVSLLADQAAINGVPVSVEASVGVVVAPAGTVDVAELLRRAHAAMRRAKQGGAAVDVYDAAQDDTDPDRPALLAELRTALERDDELVLALQPVVELATGAPIGVEALVRWRHPRRGLLLPGEFLPTVEQSDLLSVFTEYVLGRALAAATEWTAHDPTVPVAVNLSERSLLDPRLPGMIAALLRRYRLPGRQLTIELTESVVTEEPAGVEQALASLRALGVRLAVDDFGTGYASLAVLTRVALDEVKLDHKFVTDMASSVESAAIVRTTAELGRELGMRIIAEGVETAAQRHLLSRLGCPYGQGFHLAAPTSTDRIAPLLRELAAAAAAAAPGTVLPLPRRTHVAPVTPIRPAATSGS